MHKQVRLAYASFAVCAVAALSLAHVDDPKGRVPHITYMGPGWTAGSAVGDEGSLAGVPIDFPSSNIQLLSWLPVPDFDPNGAVNTTANTVEGYVSPGGREYAIIGLSDGTGFVDVTNPASPVIRSMVRCAPTPDSLWRDVRLYGQYCYAGSEGGGGIQVINMTNLDTTGAVPAGNVTTPLTPASLADARTHTMFVNPDSGILYRAGGGNNGLRMYRVGNGNAAAPLYLGAWPNHYVHEVTVVSYTSGPYAGKEIAFACSGNNPAGVYIIDVTNLTDNDPLTVWDPTGTNHQLAFYTYLGADYCHQGWLSPDKQYFYINDELDDNPQTRIVNISNLSAPTTAGVFSSGSGAIDHNLYTKGNLIYGANYRSGLRIFDAANPTAPTSIGFFDTWPPDDGGSFNGLWDADPYLPSGIILGADIEKGLFVWRHVADLLEFSYPDGTPPFIKPTGGGVDVTIDDLTGVVNPATAKLGYSINGGAYIEIPMQHLGGSAFRANFPAIACGNDVRWYTLAKTTTGVTVRNPLGAPAGAYFTRTGVSATLGVEDTLETNTGWVAGLAGDTATGGLWVRANPVGTAAQPEDDYTPAPGVNCWITGNGTVGGLVGENDVDGPTGADGITTLTSPTLDATGGSTPVLIYSRWYSNVAGSAPNADSMPVQISNNNGASWVQLELVTENAGAWVRKAFRIADFVTPTNQMKLRFIARDLNAGSIVEAGVDDVRIEYLQCNEPGDVNGDGVVNINDLLAVIIAWGPCPPAPAACPADIVFDGAVNINDLLSVIINWG